MSGKTRRGLNRSIREINANTPKILRRLKKDGIRPDPVIVFSMAKYYRALNKLANE